MCGKFHSEPNVALDVITDEVVLLFHADVFDSNGIVCIQISFF